MSEAKSQIRARMNHMLQSNGLGRLEDPGTIAQLGFLVRDHEHFLSLLICCEPEERRNMYEALAPNLTFKAKTLDEYMVIAKRDAEARQLPVIGADGQLHPYSPPSVGSAPVESVDDSSSDQAELEETVAQALDESLATSHLEVECGKCTKHAVFHGFNRGDAVKRLRAAGWRYDLNPNTGISREICPDCPGPRVN